MATQATRPPFTAAAPRSDLLAPLRKLSLWEPLRRAGTAILTPYFFSARSGHFRSSLQGRAVARDGAPLPWYTYPAIHFLAAGDYRGKRILEFGGGQSTLWWADRAGEVVTIEPDADWCERLRQSLPDNVTLHHVPLDTRTRDMRGVRAAVAGLEPFDVIVVDGHLRPECGMLAFELLAPGGAVIFDNAEDPVLRALFGRRRVIDFFGHCPGVHRQHSTAVVFDRDCFLLDHGAVTFAGGAARK